jgi:gliding motility-associated-like protein
MEMTKKVIPVLFFILSLGLSQLSAQISASDTVGCAPLVGVQFTGVAGASNVKWDFKDGNTAIINTPTNTFVNPGTYVVLYTATVGGSPVNYSIKIHVYGKPTASFTATPPTKGCVPLSVSFQSTSTGGGGVPIVTYAWTFGDGGGLGTQNPNYTYTLAGQFDVQLKITDKNGCIASIKLPKFISTSQKPNPVISSNPVSTTSCSAPFSVTFNGSSSTSNSGTSPTLTYSWTFGNGNNSAVAAPPQQTYTANGTFPVTLTVSDDNNCSNAVIQNVKIGKPVATFLVKDSVCKAVVFNSTGSTGILSWDFGDSQTGAGSSPSHTYTTGGTYTVHLHVTQGSCVNDTTRKIFVEDPKASFTSAPTYACSVPEIIRFTSTSTGVVPGSIYGWTFVTGAPAVPKYSLSTGASALPSPSVTVTDNDTNRFTIDHRDIIINATLTITTPQGCKTTISHTSIDSVFLPTGIIQPDKSRGCVPLQVAFSDSSVSYDPIVNWNYDFGDGTAHVITTTKTVVNHTYNIPGIYQARVVITNKRGCIDTSYVVVIYVGAKPTPNFTVAPTTVCVKTPVVFTNTSTAAPGSPIDTWHFYADNGFYMSSCYTDPNPTYSFGNSTGAQQITLVTCSRGCCDSLTKGAALTVNGPLVKYTAQVDCKTPNNYTFTGDIKGATSWIWNFGDGSPVVNTTTQNNITHNYTTTGNFQSYLIGHSNSTGCADDTFKLMIYVKHIKAILKSDTTVCSTAMGSFDASPSVDVFTLGNNGYVWLWNDNTPPTIGSSPIVTHQFSAPGFYYVKLIVTDENGCRDTTLSKKVKVSSVTAKFKPDHFNGCIPWTVNFTDQSISDTTLTNWSWNFGDGSPAGSGKNPSHTYVSAATNYTVQVTATNILGCSNTFSAILTPSNPNAGFSANVTQRCAGDSVHFLPVVTIDKSYSWTFGDNGTSTSVSPWHKYTASGTYTVSLTVKDSIGCMKTSTQNNYISVQDYPKVGFSSSLDSSKNLCAPVVATFKDTSLASVFLSRSWNLGTGGATVNSQTVSNPYQLPGTDTVSLTVTTTFGCAATLKKIYTIYGPKADFDLAPSTICKGAKVTFTIKDTSEVFTYHWYFGDGHDTTALSPVGHTFNFHPTGGIDNVTLVFWSAGTTCKTSITHPFNIRQIVSDFKRNNELTKLDTIHCLGSTDLFTNTSTGATSFIWHFGDGTTSTVNNPPHTYTVPGTYTVSLDINDAASGCADTLNKKIIVNPIPHAVATGRDTCLGKPVFLTSSGGLTYFWSPSAGLSANNVQNPVATPTVSTTYTVTVTDANGCTDDTTATVNVILPIPKVIFDTSIVIGQTAPLAYIISPSNDYTYTWSPTDSLSCKTCPNPKANPLVNTTYTLTVSDKFGCFTSTSTYEVIILPETSLDVPTAFTPNGDGINDIVFVKGWGIKKLLEFNIYNRWGELVFSTTDIDTGWDGYYKGVLQNVETYAWTAKVETYLSGKQITKKGFVKLLR